MFKSIVRFLSRPVERRMMRILTILLREGREMRGMELVKADELKLLKMGSVFTYLVELEKAEWVASRRETTEEALARAEALYTRAGSAPEIVVVPVLSLTFFTITEKGKRKLFDATQGV